MNKLPAIPVEASSELKNSRLFSEPETPLVSAIVAIMTAFDHAGSIDAFVEAANRAGLPIMIRPTNLVQFPMRRP